MAFLMDAITSRASRVGNALSRAENYIATDLLLGWTPVDIPDLTGKVAMVTGANSGIGFETARKLAENGAKVYIVSRLKSNGFEAADKIRAEVGKNAKVEVLECDMSSLDNVISLVKQFKRESQTLDILVNMAGVFHPGSFAKTVDGIEQTLAINVYAPALLTLGLLDRLRATPNSRVVFMASAAEQYGRLNWDNVRGDKYTNSGMTPYGTSKMMMLMFAKELAVRVPEVDFLCVHPGVVLTPLQYKASMQYWTADLIVTSARFVGLTPYKGSWSTLYAATEPSLTGVHWGYWGPNSINLWPTARRQPGNSHVRDEWKCWKMFEEMTRVLHDVLGTRYPFSIPKHPQPSQGLIPDKGVGANLPTWVPTKVKNTLTSTVDTVKSTVQKITA